MNRAIINNFQFIFWDQLFKISGKNLKITCSFLSICILNRKMPIFKLYFITIIYNSTFTVF